MVTGAVLIAAFVFLNLAFAVQRGVCCADDGAYAVIAKNLANGDGNTLTVGYGDPNYSARPFDPEVGSGPALVLPVAVAVRFLDNKSWVPGVAQVTVSALLLLAILLNLRRILGTAEAAAALGVSCWIVYAVSPYHLEQWYAMLGEVPAALTAILAIAVWAAGPSSPRRLFAAGLLLSVALLVKLLALVYCVAAIGGVAMIGGLASKRPPAGSCRS